MYNIIIDGITDKYEYNELIKIFLKPEEYTLFTETEYDVSLEHEGVTIEFNGERFAHKDHIKREIYKGLSLITGKTPPWGILTGVRPVKLAREICEKNGSIEQTKKKLVDFYLLSEEKARLLIDIYRYQSQFALKPEDKTAGLYIGIPFCPTRCLYCSFTSNQQGEEEIERYLDALLDEIGYAGRKMKESGEKVETVYIGGGTPTTLSAYQIDRLLSRIETSFDLSCLKEFTVEAGRPDTVTEEKLKVISDHGIKRISINPQTMKDHTLKLIGRSHTCDDIIKAFDIANKTDKFIINADIIAGLPEETPEDFENTVRKVIDLGPENITVHTLAVKRASRLMDSDAAYHYKQSQTVEKMLEISRTLLSEAGYRPYYLYRQKHMAGAMENVGYCRNDKPCIYNIRIMDENQSILALGAGAISKRFYADENRLERVPNVSNYSIYIERLEEMKDRKEKKFFEEV